MSMRRSCWLLLPILAVTAGTFVTGVGWGLPSRAADPFLFGDRPAWSGEAILTHAPPPPDDPTHGADVDVDPVAERDRPVCVNCTDRQRAEIVRRYRLASYQPDEIITFMALAGMRPGQGRLDPKLYQYGGLWIYPVGVLLKGASWCGAVTLTPDMAYYLDHPERFGRFYIVARLYAAGWGLAGAIIVFWMARRLAGGCAITATGAALCYAVLPVVVNMAHEAKPHLPGGVLMLLAVAAAMRYLETGLRRWWFALACACGAALGMVLSAWPTFVVIPLAVMLRERAWRRRVGMTLAGVVVGGAVYLATNPYIPINLLVNRAVLRSNFGNSLAMYELARFGEGTVTALRLILEAAALAPMALGLAGLGGFAWAAARRVGRRKGLVETTEVALQCRGGLLLAVLACVVFLQFCALGAGKPPEYARFGLFPAVALAIGGFVALGRWVPSPAARAVTAAFVVALTAVTGLSYVAGFVRDSGPPTTRLLTAAKLEELRAQGGRTMGVPAEPAPYVLPPVNLFDWRIVLMPRRPDAAALSSVDVLVRPWGTGPFAAEGFEAGDPAFERRWGLYRTPVSWADKPFQIIVQFSDDVVKGTP